MTRRNTLLLGVLCAIALLPLWAFSSPNPSPTSFTIGGTNAALEVSKTSLERTTISLRSPQVIVTNETIGYENFQRFSLDGEPSVAPEGFPALPQVTRFYRIPNIGSVELNLEELGFDLQENVNALPYDDGKANAAKNAEVYSRNAWYPSDVAVISAPMQMRDFRVVTVTLYPVQVNPVTHQARVYHTMDVSIIANNQPGANEITRVRRPSGAWKEIYRSQIANLDDGALDDATTTPGSYLILTSNDVQMLPWADSLAEWKTRKGFSVTIDARASWTAAVAMTDIRTAYETFDPPLEYVCLMGDPGWSGVGIPVDGGYAGNYDHTYARGNPYDDLEDIGVGRLSGGTQTAMATINAKIMQYERTPHMDSANGTADTTWYHRAFLYASVARGCAGNYLVMRWGKDQFVRHTGVDSVTVMTHPYDACDVNTVISQINRGVGFFLWRGSWIGGMPSTTADQTTPAGRLPITMTLECDAGDYTGTGINSPAEDFLCAGTPIAPRGGVSGIGSSTSYSMNPLNVCLTAGMIYNIADLHVENLSLAVVGAKTGLLTTYGTMEDPERPGQMVAATHTRYFNLLGEPSLSMWTDVPESLSVVHPSILYIGATSVNVTVTRESDGAAVENALVCLWKKGPDSTWVRGMTDAQGHITLPVSVTRAGDMFLTITKQNHMPYLYTIPCGNSNVMPLLSSYTLDDDTIGGTHGNGNHIMNPGETIDLPVYIRNFGDSTQATNISVTMSSNIPQVNIVSGTASYPDLSPGDSAVCATPFRIQVAPVLQNHVPVQLALSINSSAGQTAGLISLTCLSPELRYLRNELSAAFEPGMSAELTVWVQNSGGVAMPSTSGHLTSLSQWVQVIGADAAFGNISIGGIDSNLVAFNLTANAAAFRGTQAPMQLVFMSSSGFVDTLHFTVSLGLAQSTDPTGPDNYGYYVFDNTDSGYPFHPSFGYVDISTGGETNLNLNDPGDKITPTPIYSVARALPFGFKFYGQVYDTITICSNGWCAFGDQSYLDLFRNYQIPGMGAPDAMIAPYWDDLKTSGVGQGVWAYADTTNHRYIIQWIAGAGTNWLTPLDFEVILYDTSFIPTRDGNGRILIQYWQAVMNLPNQYSDEPFGCTIGIQAPGCLTGLQYAYQDQYAPGATTVERHRALLFTTDGPLLPNATGEHPNRPLPEKIALYENFPNPFNPTTQIRFDLPKAEHVQLKIYNSLGQLVATLLDEIRPAGSHTISWDGRNAATGLYFCRLQAGSFVQTRKMLLMK